MMKTSIVRIELVKINLPLDSQIGNYNSKQTDSNKLKYSDYKAIGQFDGVSIKKLNYGNIQKILYDYYTHTSGQYTGDSQMFFGLTNEDVDEFLNNQDWCYQYIIFLDLQSKDINFDNEIKKLNENGSSVIVLKTFDKHSYIVLMRSTKLLDAFNNMLEISTAGSSWNIHYRLLTLKNDENAENDFPDEKINISINFKIRDLIKFKKYIDELTSELKQTKYQSMYCNNFLSNSDYNLNIKGYPAKAFFKLFYNGNLLDRENKELYQAIRYTHTNVTLEVGFKDKDNVKDSFDNNSKEKISEYIYYLYDFEQRMIENNEKSFENQNIMLEESASIVIKIIKVLWDLNQFDRNSIYLISVILPALYEYVAQIQMENTFLNTTKGYDSIEEIHQSLNLMLNSNFRAGHDYITTPMLYYAPTKIIIFYSQYLRLLTKSVLRGSSGEQIRYEFLLSPRLNAAAEVLSFTTDSIDYLNRFLSVRMPISALYDFKNSLIALVHEAGHFIPNDSLRCREIRMKKLINGIVKITFLGVLDNINLEELDSKFTETIKNLFKEIYISLSVSIKSSSSLGKYLLVQSEKTVRDELIKILRGKQNYIIKSCYEEDLKYQVNSNIFRLLQSSYIFSIHNMYLNMERVLRECYSDLFAIKVLGLSAEDYINSFKEFSKDYGSKLNSFLNTRIAFIFVVNKWDYSFLLNNDLTNVVNLINAYLEKDNHSEVEYLPGMNDVNIFNSFIEYFEMCSIQIDKLLEGMEVVKLKNIYDKINCCIQNENIIDLIDIINGDLLDIEILYETLDKVKSELEVKRSN